MKFNTSMINNSGQRNNVIENVKNWTVYIIRCTDESLYTGITIDIKRRYEQHRSQQGAKYFRGHKPKALVYLEGGHDRSSASKREIAIKKLKRTDKIKLIASKINGINNVGNTLSG